MKSPSTRGCGLKPANTLPTSFMSTSPSTRGCGLKLSRLYFACICTASPSTRGCGLKPEFAHIGMQPVRHPPREGVDWNLIHARPKHQSYCHPPREGVDWNPYRLERLNAITVTLHARVWIETVISYSSHLSFSKSPSTRGCGLKQIVSSFWTKSCSHPPREGVDWNKCISRKLLQWSKSPSTRGCGLKLYFVVGCHTHRCHPPREGVDWNSEHLSQLANVFSHPPREGVDWNIMVYFGLLPIVVTLHARVWIETSADMPVYLATWVTLHARVWIETRCIGRTRCRK